MTTGRTPGERNELQAHLPTAKHASYEEAGSDSEIAALTAHLGDVLRTLTDDEPAEAATRGENLTPPEARSAARRDQIAIIRKAHTMSNELTLTLTTNPDTWSGAALRADFRRVAETVRAANHATGNQPGVLADVDDAGDIVGSLKEATERMTQLLAQIGAEIRRAQEAGYIGSTDLDPEVVTLTARDALDDASQTAAMLSEQLKTAWSLLDKCWRTDRFYDEHDVDEEG